MKPLDKMIKSIDDNVQDMLNDLFLKDSYRYDKLKGLITGHAGSAKDTLRSIRYHIEAYGK